MAEQRVVLGSSSGGLGLTPGLANLPAAPILFPVSASSAHESGELAGTAGPADGSGKPPSSGGGSGTTTPRRSERASPVLDHSLNTSPPSEVSSGHVFSSPNLAGSSSTPSAGITSVSVAAPLGGTPAQSAFQPGSDTFAIGSSVGSTQGVMISETPAAYPSPGFVPPSQPGVLPVQSGGFGVTRGSQVGYLSPGQGGSAYHPGPVSSHDNSHNYAHSGDHGHAYSGGHGHAHSGGHGHAHSGGYGHAHSGGHGHAHSGGHGHAHDSPVQHGHWSSHDHGHSHSHGGNLNEAQVRQRPLYHWFYQKKENVWSPFSLSDAARLEEAHVSGSSSTNSMIPTDGGRYDVDLVGRKRHAVYWDEPPSEVRRSSWFFKSEYSSTFTPYSEEVAARLEAEYQQAFKYNVWQRKVELPGGQHVVMHNPQVMVDYSQPAAIGGVIETRPRVVHRGMDGLEDLPEGEPLEVSHLVFAVHGIGATSDTGCRSIVDHVDDFRQTSLAMLHDHFPHRSGSRVEFLPVSWHDVLHGDTSDVSFALHKISLGSCPRLRDYTNTALLDILFYLSPAYCQSILSAVANEMERMLKIFLVRHPHYSNGVSLLGHSLGKRACAFSQLGYRTYTQLLAMSSSTSEGCIPDAGDTALLELPAVPSLEEPKTYTVAEILSELQLDEFMEKFEKEQIDIDSFKILTGDDLKEMGVPMGPRKKLLSFLREHNQAEERYKRELAEIRARKEATEAARQATEKARAAAAAADAQRQAEQAAAGLSRVVFQHPTAGVGQPYVRYPQLSFSPQCLFAVGSPISMFVTVRGGRLGPDFVLPTCLGFVNVFHPFDPVAYRMEPLIEPAVELAPLQVPHHKGRKRLHLELRDNLGRVGAQIKKNFMESLRQMWQDVQEFAQSHRSGSGPLQRQEEQEIAELQREVQQQQQVASSFSEENLYGRASPTLSEPNDEADVIIGRLNGGDRIDHVLQERPFESFNEYLFAIQSHSCYWTSEDTSLLMLRKIFSGESPPSAGIKAR